MNSDIPTVLKLSPVTIVKADKPQVEPRPTFEGTVDKGVRTSLSVVTANDVRISPSNATEEKVGETQKADASFSLDAVKKAVEEGNSFLQVIRRNLEFKVDEATDKLVVKIVDSESGELVRQIPSEEMLAFIERMQELEGQQGLMIQDRA